MSGTVTLFSGTLRLTVGGMPAELDSDGTFSRLFPLEAGRNTVEVAVYDTDAGSTVARAGFSVTCMPDAEAIATVGTAGGTVEVADAGSPVYGAGITLPAGAPGTEMPVLIEYDPEHFPNVPAGFEQVGEPVVIRPLALRLDAEATVMIPFDETRIPPGAIAGDIIVLGFADSDWVELPVIARNPERVGIAVDRIIYEPLVAAVRKPLQGDQLFVETTPAFAPVFIDGVDTGTRTPAVISGLSPGEHTVKLYLPGFNEIFATVNTGDRSGSSFSTALTEPAENIPEIDFYTDFSGGRAVTEAEFPVRGRVLFKGEPLPDQTVVFSLNGMDTLDKTDGNGEFDSAVVLVRGKNTLEVRVNGPDGQTFVSDSITVSSGGPDITASSLGSPDITARSSWNTDATDIDLHVFDPDGNHAWYGAPDGISGGLLDRDDTDGFGPEIFTLVSPVPGTYTFNVDSYRIDSTPTTASLEIRLGNDVVYSGSYTFTEEDFNAGNGTGGAPGAFWRAFEFEAGEIIIARVDFDTASRPGNAVFTTAGGENNIGVTVEVPRQIPDSIIGIKVLELKGNFSVTQTGALDRVVTFQAGSANPENPADPGNPLVYDVQAFYDEGTGRYESNVVRITQGIRSQIRQEYIDKRTVRGDFARATPDRDAIITASDFSRSSVPDFSFREFSRWNDFGPGLAIIWASANIAQTVRNAWGMPLRITGGYRNPRRNDRVGGVSDSFHQTGDAVDLNPSTGRSNWPASIDCDPDNPNATITINSYADAQAALVCLAERVLSPDYDVIFHRNHVHIEYQG